MAAFIVRVRVFFIILDLGTLASTSLDSYRRLTPNYPVITALHGMQTRSYDENSVHLSVCPSIKRVDCDKTEESYV